MEMEVEEAQSGPESVAAPSAVQAVTASGVEASTAAAAAAAGTCTASAVAAAAPLMDADDADAEEQGQLSKAMVSFGAYLPNACPALMESLWKEKDSILESCIVYSDWAARADQHLMPVAAAAGTRASAAAHHEGDAISRLCRCFPRVHQRTLEAALSTCKGSATDAFLKLKFDGMPEKRKGWSQRFFTEATSATAAADDEVVQLAPQPAHASTHASAGAAGAAEAGVTATSAAISTTPTSSPPGPLSLCSSALPSLDPIEGSELSKVRGEIMQLAELAKIPNLGPWLQQRLNDLQTKLGPVTVSRAGEPPSVKWKTAFLCELRHEALADVQAAFFQHLQSHNSSKKTKELAEKVGRLIDLARFVSGVLGALRSRRFGADRMFEYESTNTLLVNGDVQRGKTSVELFVAVIVDWVNKTFADRFVYVIVTTMVPWAGNLLNSAAELFGDEINAELDKLKIRVAGLSYVGGAEKQSTVDSVISEGGCLIIARTQQIKCVYEAVERVNLREENCGSTLPKTVVVLTADEADTMVGSGLPTDGVEDVPAERRFKYQRQLDVLTGANNSPVEVGAPRPQILKSPLIIYVSATNALVIFKELYDPSTVVQDVISFKDAAPEQYLCAYRKFEIKPGVAITLDKEHRLWRQHSFMNDTTDKFFIQHFRNPNSVAQVNLMSGVNVSSRQEKTMYTMIEDMLDRLSDIRFEHERGIVLTCTGGDRPAPGRVGIRFTGTQAPAMVTALEQHFVRKTKTPFTSKLPPSVRGLGADPIVIHFCLEDLKHLLYIKEQECIREAGDGHRPLWVHRTSKVTATSEYDESARQVRMTLNHLPLLLLVLREVFGQVPIIINGYRMIQRALSLVALDPITKRTVASVTAVLSYATPSASAPMIVQMVQRYCTTLTDYVHRHIPDGAVTILASQIVFTCIEGVKAFNRCFGRMSREHIQGMFAEAKEAEGTERLESIRRLLQDVALESERGAISALFNKMAKPLGPHFAAFFNAISKMKLAHLWDDDDDDDDFEETGDADVGSTAGAAAAAFSFGGSAFNQPSPGPLLAPPSPAPSSGAEQPPPGSVDAHRKKRARLSDERPDSRGLGSGSAACHQCSFVPKRGRGAKVRCAKTTTSGSGLCRYHWRQQKVAQMKDAFPGAQADEQEEEEELD